MKRFTIRNGLLAGLLLAVSCTEGPADDAVRTLLGGEPSDRLYAGVVDTAGIVVPEGCSIVAFPAADDSATRAAVTGRDERITQLQYLLYQETPRGSGVYRLRQRRQVFGASDEKTWPRKAEVMVLPNDENFRVVFLGNADAGLFNKQEVLTGVTGGDSLYTSVRLHLPGVEFTDRTMYYMDNVDFSSDDAGTDKIIYVPILLQRIVGRIDVRKQSLPAGTAVGTTAASYKQARLKNIVDTFLTDKISSSARGSYYHGALTASVERCVMGLVYAATRGDLAAAAEALYASGSNPYSVLRYRAGSADNTLPDAVKTRLDSAPTYRCVNSNFDNSIFLRLAQYLYDFFHEVPGGVAAGELTAANDKLTLLLKRYFDVTVTGSLSAHQSFVSQMPPLWYNSFVDGVGITRETGTGVCKPFESMFNPLMSYNYPAVNVVLEQMPESVDLDLTARDYLSDTSGTGAGITLCYPLKAWGGAVDDRHFSIIGLGTLADLKIRSIGFAEKATGSIFTPGTPCTVLTMDAFSAGKVAPNELRRAEWTLTGVGIKDPAAYSPTYSLNAFLDRTNAMFIGSAYNGPLYQAMLINVLGMQWTHTYNLLIGYDWSIWVGNKSYYFCKDYFISGGGLPTGSTADLTETKLLAAIKGVVDICWNNPQTTPPDAWSATVDIPVPLLDSTNVTWTSAWTVTQAVK